MIKNPINLDDAYFQFQESACRRIMMLTRELGGALIWNGHYVQVKENEWEKPGTLDRIIFGEMIPERG